MNTLQVTTRTSIVPAEALWKRAPTHDSDGRGLSDFMMLIPKMGRRPPQQIQQMLKELQEVLDYYHSAVVFADLNLKINVLWISVKPIPGICLELPAAIKSRIPEALLIAQPPTPHQP